MGLFGIGRKGKKKGEAGEGAATSSEDLKDDQLDLRCSVEFKHAAVRDFEAEVCMGGGRVADTRHAIAHQVKSPHPQGHSQCGFHYFPCLFPTSHPHPPQRTLTTALMELRHTRGHQCAPVNPHPACTYVPLYSCILNYSWHANDTDGPFQPCASPPRHLRMP